MQSTKCLPRTGGRIFKKALVTNHIPASGTRVQFCVERPEAVTGSISSPCARRWATSCHLSGLEAKQNSEVSYSETRSLLRTLCGGLAAVCAHACACARVHACVCVCVLRCSVVSHSLQLHELPPTRLLRPWDSPGKNPGVGCHALLQGIFPTQGLHRVSCIGRRVLHCWAVWEALGCGMRSR